MNYFNAYLGSFTLDIPGVKATYKYGGCGGELVVSGQPPCKAIWPEYVAETIVAIDSTPPVQTPTPESFGLFASGLVLMALVVGHTKRIGKN